VGDWPIYLPNNPGVSSATTYAKNALAFQDSHDISPRSIKELWTLNRRDKPNRSNTSPYSYIYASSTPSRSATQAALHLEDKAEDQRHPVLSFLRGTGQQELQISRTQPSHLRTMADFNESWSGDATKRGDPKSGESFQSIAPLPRVTFPPPEIGPTRSNLPLRNKSSQIAAGPSLSRVAKSEISDNSSRDSGYSSIPEPRPYGQSATIYPEGVSPEIIAKITERVKKESKLKH
jgi:hypothetical protein